MCAVKATLNSFVVMLQCFAKKVTQKRDIGSSPGYLRPFRDYLGTAHGHFGVVSDRPGAILGSPWVVQREASKEGINHSPQLYVEGKPKTASLLA